MLSRLFRHGRNNSIGSAEREEMASRRPFMTSTECGLPATAQLHRTFATSVRPCLVVAESDSMVARNWRQDDEDTHRDRAPERPLPDAMSRAELKTLRGAEDLTCRASSPSASPP